MSDTRYQGPAPDVIYRGLFGQPVELRSDDGDDTDGTTLFGLFARFDQWNEIDSWFEGRFMERLARGAFKKTMREQRDRIRVQFDHGHDYAFVGSAPLGPLDVLREDTEGPYYEVPLLDTDYNRDRILPLLRGQLMDGRQVGSQLGASYRFRVTKEEWVEPKKATDANPEKLPERTIREVTLYELGPVVFPADPTATAGVRSVSLTDHYIERQAARNGQAARAAAHLSQIAGGAAPLGTPPADSNEPPARHSEPPMTTLHAVRARLVLAGVLPASERTTP